MRKARGFRNQHSLAYEVGVSPRSISNWETGHEIDRDNLEALARVLRVEPVEIDPPPEMPDFLSELGGDQLDRIERKLDRLLEEKPEPVSARPGDEDAEKIVPDSRVPAPSSRPSTSARRRRAKDPRAAS